MKYRIQPPNPWKMLIVFWVIVITIVIGGRDVTAAEYQFTFYGKAWHPTMSDLNENNDLLAIEYIDTSGMNRIGYQLASYTNSYNKQSFMYTQSAYVDFNDHWSTIFSAGVTTGYRDTGGTCLVESGDACGVVAIGLEYNKYKLVPRVTIYGPALVFTLSYQF